MGGDDLTALGVLLGWTAELDPRFRLCLGLVADRFLGIPAQARDLSRSWGESAIVYSGIWGCNAALELGNNGIAIAKSHFHLIKLESLGLFTSFGL